MSGLVAKKLERMEDERWRIKIRDTSIELRPQFDRFVNAVIAVKDFVSAAVSSEPHATLAWAGVCIVLPLLTNPTTQQKALVEGVDHISIVIVRFAVLDRLYHSRTASPTKKDTIDLAKLFETQTIKLYSQILSYQAHVICQLARATPVQASRDVIKVDDWAVKITEIKASEAASQETFRLLGLETADMALEDQDQRMHKALEDHHQRMVKLFQQLERGMNNGSAELLAWKQTAEESKCLRTLCTNASTYQDTKNRNRQRVPNTCRWFLNNKIFHNWTENPSSALLWVTADPGCGKSVLSKSLVDDELRSTEMSTTAYFFFKEDSRETKSVLCAISALLHQLGCQRRTLLSTIVAHFQPKGSQILRSYSWLWNLLLETTRRPEAGRIVCVLDALDECEDTERAVLMDALDSLRQGGNGQLKFLVTSRPYSNIEERFDQSTIRLAGESESGNLKNEIDLVIKERVADIAKRKKLNQKTRNRRQERLIETENRTYLWLHLVLPGLENTLIRNPSDVDLEIDRLSSLDDAYEAILNRSPRPEQARRLLHIIVAAVRPLTVHEMNIAFNIRRSDKCLDAMDLDPEGALISHIKNVCGLFVSVHNSRVYLLHQTAKVFLVGLSRPDRGLHGATPSATKGDDNFYRFLRKYLHKNDLEDDTMLEQTTPERSRPTRTDTSNVENWKHSLTLIESHHVLAETCLSYLSFDFMDEPIDFTYEEALSYSDMNLDAAERDSIAPSDGLDDWDEGSSLFAVSEPMHRDHNHVPPSSGRLPRDQLSSSGCPRHHAREDSLSATGGQMCLECTYELPSSGPAPHETLFSLGKPRDSAEDDPLSARSTTISVGERSLVLSSDLLPYEEERRDLLSEGHDFLQYASQNWASHYEAARQDNSLQATWLSFCIPDSPKLAKWSFLQRNHVTRIPANISQLALASSFGHNRIVAHLLNENADIESRDPYGCTPLIWAVRRGNETTVDLLLASGALVNSEDLEGQTSLWFAAKLGEDKIAEKLVHGGAFVNPELKLESPESVQDFDDMGRNWSSPLAAAVTEVITSRFAKSKEASYLNVIRLLLDRGAVVDSGTRQASPLLLALEPSTVSVRGQEEIVKLLLHKGANVDIQGTEWGLSPLHRAVAIRLIQMIRLILKERPMLNLRDCRGQTPLHTALSMASGINVETIVQMLLEAGADPNATRDDQDVTERFGETPLFYAIQNRRYSMVPVLLEAGGDPNIGSYRGTALHAAARAAEIECVKLLLKAGADANSKDGHDRTPLDVAQEALEGEQKSNKQQEIEPLSEDFILSLRDLEALMKIVELLKPVTAERDGTRRFAPGYQPSESDSFPGPLAAHPPGDPGFELRANRSIAINQVIVATLGQTMRAESSRRLRREQ